MNTTAWQPLSPHRSWRTGAWIAAATTTVIGVDLLWSGRRAPLAWGLLGVSLVVAVLAMDPRIARAAQRGQRWWLQYAWTGCGLLGVLALALVLDEGPVALIGLFTVTMVAATGSYPRRGARAVQALTVAVMVVTGLAVTTEVPAPQVVAVAVFTVMLVAGAGAVARDLERSLAVAAEERARAETRNRLLGLVGRTVTLDLQRAADLAVDAVAELGFSLAGLSVIEGDSWVPLASRGAAEAELRPSPLLHGLAGRALLEDRSVAVDDYSAEPDRLRERGRLGAAVVVLIRSEGEVIGALMGARTRPGPVPAADVELLEVVAEHVGPALANSRRYAEEQRVVSRLRELDRLKRDFISDVSHELRTPLSAVRGLTSTLRRHERELGPERTTEFLARIAANATRLGTMLDGLLDFSARGDGRHGERDVEVDVAAQVRDCVDRLEPTLRRHRVTVHAPDELVVCTDRDLVDHATENLLTNAAKYTPPGTPVVVTLSATDGGARIEVRDHGPGIPADELPHLTTRYWRGGSSAGVAGTGLGLALVRDLLASRGSELEIRSGAGTGSSFAFHLPTSLHAGGRP